MKTILTLATVLLLLSGCTSKHRIKKDLNSRFTKFEIVEIHSDAANVRNAFLDYLDISMLVVNNSTKISSILSDYFDGKQYWTTKQYSKALDTLYFQMEKRLTAFEESHKLKESCIYVKYRIPDGVRKIEKEEYFQFDGKKTYRRPTDWDEWLKEIQYGTVIDMALLHYSDINEIRGKASRSN